MKHYMKLDPIPFEKIASGKKSIELRLYDSKRKLINPEDKIVFQNAENPFRTIQVTVISLLTASSFDALFKHVSLVECGFDEKQINNINASVMEEYYTIDDQQTCGVVGIKFSVDSTRTFSEIKIPEDEIKAFFTTHTDLNKIENKEVKEWLLWHENNYSLQGVDDLSKIINLFDTSIDAFVEILTDELMKKAEDCGYDDIEEYLDRPFHKYDYFYVYSWWRKTEKDLVEYYCGVQCFNATD